MSNTKKAKPKRLLSLLLTLAMVLGMLPAMSVTASAAEMTYIKHVDIQMTAPRAGMTAEEYAATIGVDNKHELSYNNLVVDTLNCYRVDDSSFDHVGTDVPSFVEDGVYHCFVDIVMNDDTGYQFEHDDSEITVLVNGQTLDNYDYDRETGYVARFDNDGYTLTYALYFTATSITGSGTEDDPYIVTDYDKLRNLMQSAPYYGPTCYIKLGADVSNNQNESGIQLLCTHGQCIDLDLNGHEISRTGVSTDQIFYVHNGAKLTIRDSAVGGGGKVTSNLASNENSVLFCSVGSEIIVEGGTFESNYGYAVFSLGYVTINGGTFIAHNCHTIYVTNTDSIGMFTMNGGHVSNTDKDRYSILINGSSYVNLCAMTADTKIHKTRGEVDDMQYYIPWSSEVTQGNLEYRTIEPDEETGLIKIEKDYYTAEGSGTAEDPYVVYDGDLLWRLFYSAPRDGTTRYIKLGADLEATHKTEIVHENNNINLDLNGHVFTRKYVYVERGSLTIGDSAGGGEFRGTLNAKGYGQLTINGGSYYCDSQILNGSGYSTVIINGGTFYGAYYHSYYPIMDFRGGNDSKMTVVINDGQFYNSAINQRDIAVVIGYDARYVDMTLADLLVEGRIVKRYDVEATGILSDIPESSTLEVYGENFRDDNDDILTASKDHNGWIKITKNTPISSVDITGVTAPKVGETVDFSATVNTNGTVKAGVTWVDMESKRELSAGETFREGHSYMVVVTLTAKDRYAFNTTNDTLNILINGKKGFLWYASGKKVQCCYCFDAAFPKPVITTQPAYNITIGEGEGFTLSVKADYATGYEWHYVNQNGTDYVLEKQILYYKPGTEKTNTLVMNYYDYNRLGYLYCRVYGPGGYTDTNEAHINVLPVEYDLWVGGEQVTSENKKYLAYNNDGWATYLPYENELRLWDGLKINYTAGERVDFSDGGCLENNYSGILYYTPAGATARELKVTVQGDVTVSGNIGIRALTSPNAIGTGSIRVIGWNNSKDEDTLTINCSSPFLNADVTIEDCTVNVNGSLTDINTAVYNADLNISSGEIPLKLTDLYKTVSVFGNSTMTLKGGTRAVQLKSGFYDTNPSNVNQILCPAGSNVYVGTSADGSGAALWTGKTVPVWIDYKYVRIEASNPLEPFAICSMKMATPTAGKTLSSPTLLANTNFAQHIDKNSITCTLYLKSNLSAPLDVSTYTLKAGTSYRLYVDVDAENGYCFSEGVYTRFNITGMSTEYPTDVENTGSHLRFYVDFTIASEATGVTVSGTATSFNSDTDEVIIQLTESGAAEASYEAVVKGNTASYSIADVPAGTYTMKVMKQNHVTREYTVTVGSSNVVQDVKICLLGDVTGDGKVNTKDWARLKAHVNETSNLTGYELACGDVNGDSKVNIKDWARLKAHVNESNPLW